MDRYLVISHHAAPECILALKEVLAIGYLTHFQWGCKDGVHTGWATIDADTKEQAMLSVPVFLRNKAQIVRLAEFRPEQVEKMHDK